MIASFRARITSYNVCYTKLLRYDQFVGDDNVLIVINADPDAIASAMAVKRLLWRKVSSVTIRNNFV